MDQFFLHQVQKIGQNPLFLKEDQKMFTRLTSQTKKVLDDQTPDREVGALSLNLANNTKILDSFIELRPTTRFISRFSSLYRLKLATTWLLRYKDYLITRAKFDLTLLKPTQIFKAPELQRASNNLVIYEQHVHFNEEMPYSQKISTKAKRLL